MKTTQYVRQEKAIAAADAGSIRARWLWGLRILRDPEAVTPSGKSLRLGVSDQLITAARSSGLKLSEREIQRRLQCARTYPTEVEIRQALADFETWDDLHRAGFPPYAAPEDEPAADHRTEVEKQRDRARRLVELVGDQGSLFPLDEFEPTEATLKELVWYADEQDAITFRFVNHGQKRRAYLDRLVDAANGDLSWTWAQAAALLPSEDPAS